MSKKLTTEEFKRRAKEKHGDRYSYDKVDYKHSNKNVIIICPIHGEFPQTPHNHIAGNGCPICSGRKVEKRNSLAALRPDLSKEWHPTKNGKLTPEDVGVCCNKKVWWLCSKGHSYDARVFSRAKRWGREHGSKCSYCSGKKVCKDNCLSTVNPDLAKEWHPTKNGKLTPEDVTPYSIKKVFWLCSKGHFYDTIIHERHRGVGCPYCSGQKVCKDNCLSTVNPDLAKEWHPTKNGKLTPEDVTKGCVKKVFWLCPNGHYWKASVRSRSSGNGCGSCSTLKSEKEVGVLLENNFVGWKIKRQKKIWDKYRHYHHRRYCDFWLEKDGVKIIVEYDGIQHFMPVAFNGISMKKAEYNFKKTKLKDKLDAKFCQEQGIILYRIKYDEDKEESIKKLAEKILQKI